VSDKTTKERHLSVVMLVYVVILQHGQQIGFD